MPKHVIATLLQDIQLTLLNTLETITSMVLLYGELVCVLKAKILFLKLFWKNGEHIWRAG